jgi:hypothetical protein
MRPWVVVMLCCTAAGAVLPRRAPSADGVMLPLSTQDQQEITAQLGPGVIGAALPSKPIEDASLYFPLQERAITYQLTAGKNAGTTHRLHVAKAKRANGIPAWRFGLTPSIEGFIHQTPAAISSCRR